MTIAKATKPATIAVAAKLRRTCASTTKTTADSRPPTKKENAAIKTSFIFTNACHIHTGLLARGHGCEMFDACVANASTPLTQARTKTGVFTLPKSPVKTPVR